MKLDGKQVLETDEGFILYQYLETHCYIIDIYVKPEFRQSRVASVMADTVAVEAKGKGYNKLLGSVKPSNKGSNTSLKVLLCYGFKLLSSQVDGIIFEKDI